MTLDRNYIIGIITAISGIAALVLGYLSFLSTRETDLSRKIESALSLLPKCHFDIEKEKTIGELLLLAKKKLDIDDDYSQAANLLNSISSDMWSCSPTLEANQTLMLFTTTLLIIGVGILIIVRHYQELHNS